MKRKISVVLAAVLGLNVNFAVKASGEFSPELIAYEDFKYEDYVGADITTIPGAMNADPDKGFSSGYKKTSSGTAVTAASHRIEQDENGDYYVKALKYSPDKLYRMFDENSIISIRPESDGTSLYYITWEQYLGENVVLAGSGNIGDNDGQRIEFAENNIMMGFKKNTSGDAIPFIRWGRTEEGQAWGERAMYRGRTYKMVMKLVPSAAGKDVVTLKAYPKDEYPLEDWDVGVAIAGSTPWSHYGFATGALVSGGDNDQRFANLKIEHFNSADAVTAIEDAEEKTIAAVEAIKAGDDAEELILLANESLDMISDCEAKNAISSMLDGAWAYSDIYKNLSELAVNYSDELMEETRLLIDLVDGVFVRTELEKSLNEIDAMLEVGVLVEKAEETKSDEDIRAALEAVNNLPSGNLKSSYEERINAIIAEKDAALAVEAAETDVSKESFDAALELVEALPDGDVKDELAVRLEAIRKVIAENYAGVMVDKAELDKTNEALENALSWVNALDDGDLKTELSARLELLAQSISLIYIRDVFDYPAGTLVNSVEKLMSADEENGFSTGWTTKSDLTGKPGNNVSFDGKGLMLINGVNNIEAYRGLSNKINFAEDGEYYVSWKQYVYPEAKNGTNQSQRFKFSVKGEAEPRFKLGFIGNGVNGFNLFVKDTSGIVQYEKEYPADVVYNFRMRISTTAEGMDKISVKMFAEGEKEPSDWQIVRTASSDYCIDMIGFRSNFNPVGNHGLGSILVEKYTSDVLSAFSNAEAAVKAAVTEGTQSALANAEAQLSKICDCLAKEDLRSRISELSEKFEIVAECNEILSEIESVQITESNASEISEKLDYIKEKLLQLPEDISSGIRSRCNAIENKLNTVLISAERVVDKFDGNNWFGNDALDTPVDESAQSLEMYRAYTFDMTDSIYYARLTFTPSSGEAEFKVGDAKVSVSGLNANAENTIVIEAGKDSLAVYSKDGKKLASVDVNITDADTLGLIAGCGTAFDELEIEKVNSNYLSSVADALALQDNVKLDEIAAAEAAVEAFAPSIVKDMLENKIAVATEENEKLIPELTVAKIDGLGVVGETLKAVAEVSDNGGNFKEYRYEWSCGSKKLSDTFSYKVEKEYASKIITLTITPYSVYGTAGKAVSDTIKIKAQSSGGSGGGGSGGGSGGGGGKNSSGGAAALGNAAASAVTKPVAEMETTNAEKAPEFVDIDSHWAKEDIEYMASKGIVSGVNNNFFVPDNNITRAEFATLLCRLCGFETKATDDFADVAADAWYNGYVGAVVNSGIMSGSDSGFKPDAFITRQEMAKGIVNSYAYLGKSMETKETPEFSDYASISDWAKEYVNKCASIGIMVGDSDGAFRPLANATRAEATVVIKRVFISK